MSEQNYLGVLYSSRLLLCQCLLSIHWQLHLEHTCWCCGSGGSLCASSLAGYPH